MCSARWFFAAAGLLLVTPNHAQVCSNGVAGIETDRACCVTECGTCGGVGCGDRAKAAGLTADDCCVGRIFASGTSCDDSEAAPCIVDNENQSSCSNGVTGIEADGACCMSDCRTCGGVGCSVRAAAVGLTADDCCIQRITASGVLCEDSDAAPCIVSSGSCDPSLAITLEWSDASSDVDLYVTEPDGTIVSYQRPLGGVGFLEDDDTGGFGPETYIILSDLDPDSSSVLGEYQAQARLYEGFTESWNLTARIFGEVVWVEQGDFASSSATDLFSVSLTDYDPICGGSFGA